MANDVLTGTSSRTIFSTLTTWNGHGVRVTHDSPCPVIGHDLEQMHHYGPDDKDWGPTGFLWCSECCGIADDPDDPEVS